jgi:HK97 family phage major capsid protein
MSKFPLLHVLASESRSSVGLRHLTREQVEAQEELRSEFRSQFSTSGCVLPWYEPGRERRDMTATGGSSGNQGGMSVGTDVLEIGAALRDQLVLEKMGARVFGGLRSDIDFPRGKAGLAAEWLSENAEAAEQSFTFGKLALTARRVTAWIDVSWQLLMQGASIERFLRLELMGALAHEIQRAVIAGSGSSGQPLGILNTPGLGSVVGGADGLAPTYANICGLEETVATAKADRGNLGWLVSPAGRRKLRNTEALASSGNSIWPLSEAYSLFGYPAGVVTAVPDNLTKGASTEVCSAIAFLEFSELIICFWGPGIGVEAHPVGSHLEGKTRIFATAHVDGGLRTPEACAAMLDALCAA